MDKISAEEYLKKLQGKLSGSIAKLTEGWAKSEAIEAFVPLSDKLLVLKVQASTRNSALYIPNSVESGKLCGGIVLKSGPGLKKDGELVPISIQPYSFIVFQRWSAIEIADDIDLVFVKESDVVAKVDPN